jgi:hypothetical protein
LLKSYVYCSATGIADEDFGEMKVFSAGASISFHCLGHLLFHPPLQSTSTAVFNHKLINECDPNYNFLMKVQSSKRALPLKVFHKDL